MINITQYTNNQFEPKELIYKYIPLSVGVNTQSTYTLVGNLTYTVAKTGIYDIAAHISHSQQAAARGTTVRITIDGVELAGTPNKSYFHSTDMYGKIICERRNRILEAGQVVNVEAFYSGAFTLIRETAYENSYLEIQERRGISEPNTYPFLVNADPYNLTVTGSNWTTARAIGVPYRLKDGTWRMTFNITGNVSSATGSITLSVNGVTFKNTTDHYQAVSVSTGAAAGASQTTPNTNNIVLSLVSSITVIRTSGDVELENKPTWL